MMAQIITMSAMEDLANKALWIGEAMRSKRTGTPYPTLLCNNLQKLANHKPKAIGLVEDDSGKLSSRLWFPYLNADLLSGHRLVSQAEPQSMQPFLVISLRPLPVSLMTRIGMIGIILLASDAVSHSRRRAESTCSIEKRFITLKR